MYEYFLILIASIWLVFASIFDFKKREIPDWLSFSLIVFAFAYRAFVSLFIEEWKFLLNGTLGFALFFFIGNLAYRTGFGGGDAKLLMALGAILPFSLSFNESLVLLGGFLLVTLFVGAFYSLVYSLFIVARNIRKFKFAIKEKIKSYKTYGLTLGTFVLISAFLAMFEQMFLIMAFLLLIFSLLILYAKAVEDLMIRKVFTSELTIGDWLVSDVKIGKKIVKAKITGIDEEDLKILKNCKKKVLIKDGLPFTISFLIGFLLVVRLWNSYRSLFDYNLWF